MLAENEIINTEENNQFEEHPTHRSWFSAIIDRIQELDTEFPLSGGEDGHHHVIRKHHHTAPKKEIVKEPVPVAVEPEHHHTSWFSSLIHKIQDLDSDFPLSGGEPTRHYHN